MDISCDSTSILSLTGQGKMDNICIENHEGQSRRDDRLVERYIINVLKVPSGTTDWKKKESFMN
jgi:hypothetical protein